MSKERKAELQRKLAMTTVPRPPADLLDRIKADIPVDLGVPERDPSLWRSTLVMRVAASLMLLVTTGLVTWRVLQPDVRRPVPVSVQRREPIVPAITRSVTRPAEENVEVPPVAETAANVLERPIVVPQSAPAPAPAKPAATMIESAEEKDVRDFAATGSAAQMADAADSSASRVAESITVTASAPAALETSASAAASSPAPPPPPPPAATAPTVAQRATLGAVRKESAAETSRLFGVSLDSSEFARVQRSLATGVRPRRVDVEAIVNHFAAAPDVQPSILSAELSSAPLDRDRLLLRISIDADSASVLTDARLKVEFPSDSVRHARRIGGGEAFTPASSPSASSVTVIYEIQPRVWLPPEAPVAEITLEGPTRSTTEKVTAAETRGWKSATRRHRLATLAGLWAESLSRSSTNVMLGSLARELHEEQRSDPRARELAAAVEASTRTD